MIRSSPHRATIGWLAALLLLAAGWRVTMALLMPVLARDGVTFCWYARALGEQGLTWLRDPQADQHPLYPTLILGLERTAQALGAADAPLTWQVCGQIVAFVAGLAVVVLIGLLTQRIIRRLALPVNPLHAALAAMLLAAVLPLNIWLSVDAMSDQPHLALYLAGLLLLVQFESRAAALGVGLLGGLAFLTREEGVVLIAGALAVLVSQYARRRLPWHRALTRAALCLLGFLVCAAPYWSMVGRFSTKKDPVEWLQGTPAEARADPAELADAGVVLEPYRLAKLPRHDLPWYALLPYALQQLFRAGRVVVPLLALLPIVNLRRRLLEPELAGLTTCFAGHFALTLMLLARHDYLQPRHMLVPVALLTPFAGMFLARLVDLCRGAGRRGLAALVVFLAVLPLALYSLRIPNAQDAAYGDAIRWLQQHEPALRDRTLLGGSSSRRIAFYTDMPWSAWAEEPEKYDDVVYRLREIAPGYFALETGPGAERTGNQQLLERLLADPALADELFPVLTVPVGDESALHLLRVGRPPQRQAALAGRPALPGATIRGRICAEGRISP